jgi:hypothetical protein
MAIHDASWRKGARFIMCLYVERDGFVDLTKKENAKANAWVYLKKTKNT